MDKAIYRYRTSGGLTMEYSIVGRGEPVVLLHGGHSSCQEEWGGSELAARGYAVIVSSRPGYGGTSRELGESMTAACDAYMELFDELRIAKAHIIAVSAGGPSGIHLAARYPQRVKSLVLLSAVTRRWMSPDDKLYRTAQRLFRPPVEKYVWAMTRVMNRLLPDLLFGSMIPSFSKLPKEKVWPQISDADRQSFRNMIDRQRSGYGFLIDLVQTGQETDAALAAIQCPTLIMHSLHDASVSAEHARHAHRRISDSRLCELDMWGHLIWLGTGSDEMYRQLFLFLAEADGRLRPAGGP